MKVSREEMGHATEVLIFGLLLATVFWKGVQCVPGYELTIHNKVSVQEGLCINIPCNFSFNAEAASSRSILYGYWFDNWVNHWGNPVATNNKNRKIDDRTVGRFNLSENVGSKNCSLIIDDARKEDERSYYFRMEWREQFSYRRYKEILTVKVTNQPNPVILIPDIVRAGRPVNITCVALGSCSLKRPHLAWEGLFDQTKTGIPMAQSNSSMDWLSLLDFIPSVESHGHRFTCRVTYGEGPTALCINKTAILNVTYPPQKLWISAEVVRSNQELQNYTVASQLEVEKGVSVTLSCRAYGNPSPSVTWVKILHPSGIPQSVTDNRLVLPNVTAQDVGKYECRALNTEGLANASFHLSIAYDTVWQPKVIHGVISCLVVFGIVTLIVGAILVGKRWQKKRTPVTVLDSNTKQKTIERKSPPSVKDSSSIALNSEKRKDLLSVKGIMEEAIYDAINEPEDLHYASVTFNPLRPLPEASSEYSPTEYAEVKTS